MEGSRRRWLGWHVGFKLRTGRRGDSPGCSGWPTCDDWSPCFQGISQTPRHTFILSSPGGFVALGRASACWHWQRPDPPQHVAEQPTGQMPFCQQEPVVPRMLHELAALGPARMPQEPRTRGVEGSRLWGWDAAPTGGGNATRIDATGE